jgi:hypothetical protein
MCGDKEAGHPTGFDAGEYFCDASYANLGEAGLQRTRRLVQEPGLGLISGHAYSAPYEDVTLRGK